MTQSAASDETKSARPGTFAPLAGLVILEVCTGAALSFAARLLGDLGAEVVKIEPPEGDALRRQGPFMSGAGEPASALFGYLNAGKRCVGMEIADPAATPLLARFVGRSDLVLFDANAEAALLRDLLVAGRRQGPAALVFSPYGLKGARADRAGSSFTAQHSGGYAYHQAYPATDPGKVPPTGAADREADMILGLVAANAALWALMSRRDGEARPVVDLSAEDGFAYLLVDALADLKEGRLGPTRKRLPGQGITIAGGLVWFLPCSDGAIMVSPREDHQWARWVKMMGDPAWARDKELCGSRAIRTTNAARLQELMEPWAAGVKAQDTFRQAQAAKIACFPICSATDLLENSQLLSRLFFETLSAPGKTDIAMPGLPFLVRSSSGATLPRPRRRAFPQLVEQADV